MSRSNPDGGGQTGRTFLARSSVLAGASVAGVLDPSRRAYGNGSDQLKIGLINCGGRGSGSIADALSVIPGPREEVKRVLAPARYDWATTPSVLVRGDGTYPHPILGLTQGLPMPLGTAGRG